MLYLALNTSPSPIPENPKLNDQAGGRGRNENVDSNPHLPQEFPRTTLFVKTTDKTARIVPKRGQDKL
jgi:hypothetical protein